MKILVRSRGDCLIGILVLIAVLAILAAILMPAVLKARDSADNVVCLNNLKQIAEAQFIMANKNGGKLVTPPDGANGSSDIFDHLIDTGFIDAQTVDCPLAPHLGAKGDADYRTIDPATTKGLADFGVKTVMVMDGNEAGDGTYSHPDGTVNAVYGDTHAEEFVKGSDTQYLFGR